MRKNSNNSMETVPKTESFWEDHNTSETMSQSTQNNAHLQYERNLNFSTVNLSVDESDYGFQKKKSARDPLSHRIIEKRRRDRMNNCLADLARLLPQASLRKGRGRIEKTEIVELAIKHLKHLQSHPCPHGDKCEFSPLARQSNLEACSQNLLASSSSPLTILPRDEGQSHSHVVSRSKSSDLDQIRRGYQECLKETMHFLMERKGMVTGDNFYVQLVDYLNRHADSFIIPGHTNDNLSSRFYGQCIDGLSDADGELYSTNCEIQDGNCEIDQKSHKIGFEVGRHEKGAGDYCVVAETHPGFDYDNNSGSSTPLSIEISEVNSCDGKPNPKSCIKPPIPSIIGSHSSFNSSGSSAVLSSSNGRSSDEGSASASMHRYKFKNTIKQRFTADLETTSEPGTKHHHRYHHHHRATPKSNKEKNDYTSSSNPSEEIIMDDEQDQAGVATDVTEVSEGSLNEKSEKQIHTNTSVPGFETNDPKSELPLENSAFSVTNSVTKLELRDSKSPLQKLNRQKPVRFGSIQDGGGVPAFALHENGLFYVPLTLDKSFARYTSTVDVSNPHTPLHPVTISVCFMLSPKEEDLGTQLAPPEIKFSDLSVQNFAEVLNLKLEPTPPLPCATAGPSAIYTPHSSYIMNRFAHSQSPHSRQSPNSVLQSRHHNSSPNAKYQPLPPMSLHGGSPHQVLNHPKSGSPPLFSPYEFPHTRAIVPNHIFSHNHSLHGTSSSSNSSNFSGTPISAPRPSRKRHLASSPSDSSSVSVGYHSWRGNNPSSTTESASDETNTSSYASGSGSFTEESSLGSIRLDRPKSYHHHNSPGSKRANSPPKKQRKGNLPRGDGTNSSSGKSLINF